MEDQVEEEVLHQLQELQSTQMFPLLFMEILEEALTVLVQIRVVVPTNVT
jgi:hypothetical protein